MPHHPSRHCLHWARDDVLHLFGFLWGENEYTIGIGRDYMFLANAAQELLTK